MQTSRHLRSLLTAVVLATAVAACGPGEASTGGQPTATFSTTPLSEIEPLADPRAHQGPSTAGLADRAVEPIASSPKQQLPVTVTSHDRAGDKKVVVHKADRILTLDMSGTLSATVWALGLGDRLVARDTSTTFPGAKDLPVVTNDGHSVNAEAVLRARPSLVITDGSVGPRDVIEQLRDAGVTVVFVDEHASFAGAQKLAVDVAEILGVPDTGRQLAARLKSDLADVRAQIERIAPKDADDRVSIAFLYLRGASGIYYLFGQDSGATDLIEGLGATDVASAMGWKEMQPLSDEAVVAANPDLFLVMSNGLKSVGGVDQLLKDKPSLALTNAGRNRRFVDMADGDVLSFGPRSAQILEALARAVYAPDAP